MRLLPERMAALAVAGSVAWSYLPRTTAALTEIREAQMARGYRPRGIRDAAPLVVPLLAGGLERAMITAEALEARAFGAPLGPELTPRLPSDVLVVEEWDLRIRDDATSLVANRQSLIQSVSVGARIWRNWQTRYFEVVVP